MRSLGLSAIDAFLLRIKRKNILLLLSVKRRTTTAFTSRDNSNGDNRSLHCGLSAPPPASQPSLREWSWKHQLSSNDRNVEYILFLLFLAPFFPEASIPKAAAEGAAIFAFCQREIVHSNRRASVGYADALCRWR